jgi:hypothetical protein
MDPLAAKPQPSAEAQAESETPPSEPKPDEAMSAAMV